MIWCRPIITPPTTWHVGEPGAHSFLADCDGRWPNTDPTETHDDPPLHERCTGCVRALGVAQIDVGLRELCDYDFERARGVHGFDLGGGDA